MATRQELVQAIAERYRAATRKERRQILNEFVTLTGYHRKHAIRALAAPAKPSAGGFTRACTTRRCAKA